MADDGDSGFLSRWSRRKAQARAPDPPQADAPHADAQPVSSDTGREAPAVEDAAPLAQTEPTEPQARSDPLSRVRERAGVRVPVDVAPPLPTLDDVEHLTPDADFAPFIDRLVQPEVRNAAMKKLFTDPHFNVMDGLDVYIDDYNKSEPMPRQWLRQLVQARVLGLLDDEVEEQPRPEGFVPPPSDHAVASDDAAAAANDAGAASNEADLADHALTNHTLTNHALTNHTLTNEAAATTPPDTPRAHEDTDLQLQPDDAAGRRGARAAADDGADPRG